LEASSPVLLFSCPLSTVLPCSIVSMRMNTFSLMYRGKGKRKTRRKERCAFSKVAFFRLRSTTSIGPQPYQPQPSKPTSWISVDGLDLLRRKIPTTSKSSKLEESGEGARSSARYYRPDRIKQSPSPLIGGLSSTSSFQSSKPDGHPATAPAPQVPSLPLLP
jgi:hypothetical protein